MYGFKKDAGQSAPAQNFANGGFVARVKRAVGIKPPAPAPGTAGDAPTKTPAPAPAPAPSTPHALSDYAGMGAHERRMKAAGLKNGGPVRGPGTGTSDSIATEVPEGSYIMPTDSTATLGEEQIAGMGFGAPVPVNLSNGEYQLPPEQVHAVGVAALDQIKDATHAPVAQGQTEPDLYFANGGEVDPKKNRNSPDNVWPNNQPYKDIYKASAEQHPPGPPGATTLYMQDRAADLKGQINAGNYAGAVGSAARTAAEGLGMYAVAGTEKTFGPVVDAAKRFVGGFAGNAQAAPATPAAPAKAQALATPPVGTPGTAPAAPAALAASSESALSNNVTREGNSYSGRDITAGFTINGQEPGLSGNTPSAQTMGAADALADRYGMQRTAAAQATPTAPAPDAAGFQPGSQVAVIPDASRVQRERQNMLRAMSTPLSGAQNGQLTANQVNAMRALTSEETREAGNRYSTDQNNATQREVASLRDSGDTQRAHMREVAQNSREAPGNALDVARFQEESGARGFTTRAAARLEKLHEKYDAAKPEERTAIAQQIRDLQGNTKPADAKDRFMVTGGGQEWDANSGMMRNVPQRVFDAQTRQFVDGAQQAAPMPPKAQLVKGQTYQTPRGTARWDGAQFTPV